MDFDARKKKCVWKILKHAKEASFGKAALVHLILPQHGRADRGPQEVLYNLNY